MTAEINEMDVSKPQCWVLVGMPASGKSTWIEELFKLNPDEDIRVVSSDNYIKEKADKDGITYNEGFTKYGKAAQAYVFNVAKVLAKIQHKIVVIDRTNLTPKSRARFVKIFENTHELRAFVFPTPDAEEHYRRLNERLGKTIPNKVLKNMATSYQQPTTDEGFIDVLLFEEY